MIDTKRSTVLEAGDVRTQRLVQCNNGVRRDLRIAGVLGDILIAFLA